MNVLAKLQSIYLLKSDVNIPRTLKRILYIGNHLSSCGVNPSVAESIYPMLMPKIQLRLVSKKKNKFLRFVEMICAIFIFGRKEQPVCIDVYSSLNFYYALFTAFLCRILGISYCCILHGGNLSRRLNNNPLLSKYLFGFSIKNIAPSLFLKETFSRFGYSSELIPNFLPLDRYTFKSRTNFRARLLWVRAFSNEYNPQLAIEIVKKLKLYFPSIKLEMIGPDKDGSLYDCIKLVEKYDLHDSIIFSGRLSKREWIEKSQKYDIFINTTNIDNTPISVMEAMALGIPVVSTNVGGLPYLIRHGIDGILVPPNDIDVFCNAIINLVEDNTLALKLCRNARAKVDGFSWENVAPLWEKLFTSTRSIDLKC